MILPNWSLKVKVIIILVVVVLLAEVVWAVWTVKNRSANPAVEPASQLTAAPVKASTVLSLTTAKTDVQVGQLFEVKVDLFSNKTVEGVDVLITYDPKILEVQSVNKPIALNQVFDDYPVNIADPSLGKVVFSGISSSSTGAKSLGVLGSLTFKAKALGKAKISLDFTPGSTKDSNVIDSQLKRDILERVDNLDISIIP